jgi:hypothetical protein
MEGQKDENNPFDKINITADIPEDKVGYARLAVEARGTWSQTCHA